MFRKYFQNNCYKLILQFSTKFSSHFRNYFNSPHNFPKILCKNSILFRHSLMTTIFLMLLNYPILFLQHLFQKI